MTSIGVSASFHEMDHGEKDPAELIREKVGDLSGLDLAGVQVLVGTYIRPGKTKGGIILTDKIKDEDLYQGKVGLVLKVAPGAFVDAADAKFNGFTVKEGDWVFFRVMDGAALSIQGHHCRMLEDVHVRGKLKNPDMVL